MPKIAGAQRESDHINRRVTQSIFRSFDYAEATARPLNTYIVIHLHERASAGAATQFIRIRHKFRDWLNYKSKTAAAPVPPIYAYSFEKPNQAIHVNWAVHVPDHLKAEFAKKLLRWVERVTGQLGPYDVSCKPIPAAYAKRLAKYFVKGTDPAFIDHFHLRDVHAPQGKIWDKRAGTSPAIGPAVRREARFYPPSGRYAAFLRQADYSARTPAMVRSRINPRS
jgi:hypothetical protein